MTDVEPQTAEQCEKMILMNMADISQGMEELRTTGKTLGVPELDEEFEKRFQKLAILERKTHQYQDLLPRYDRQRMLSQMQILRIALSDLRAEVLPRKPFQFTRDLPEEAISLELFQVMNRQQIAPISQSLTVNSISLVDDYVCQNRSHERIHVDPPIDGTILLMNCSHCLIECPVNVSSVHAKGITGCTLIFNEVNSSLLLENLENSRVICKSQQLRVHSSLNCVFYLEVFSIPMIEDCKALLFSHSKGFFGESEGKNYWHLINDMSSRRRAGTPNYMLLDETLRVRSLEELQRDWTSVPEFRVNPFQPMKQALPPQVETSAPIPAPLPEEESEDEM